MFNFFHETANFTMSVVAIPFLVILVLLFCLVIYVVVLCELFKLIMEMLGIKLQKKSKNNNDDTSP